MIERHTKDFDERLRGEGQRCMLPNNEVSSLDDDTRSDERY